VKNDIIEYYSEKGLEIEFNGLEGWGDFELIFQVLRDDFQCKVIKRFDGPYSKYCEFIKDGIGFRLLNHPDIGNSLCLINQNEKDNEYLKQLAQNVLKILKNRGDIKN